MYSYKTRHIWGFAVGGGGGTFAGGIGGRVLFGGGACSTRIGCNASNAPSKLIKSPPAIPAPAPAPFALLPPTPYPPLPPVARPLAAGGGAGRAAGAVDGRDPTS
ncbi:MAG: hypothetical protein ACPIOQ_72295, partial [Promethearchaeia archaeon]